MGNPFVHVELSSTDPAAAKAFYGELFSWQLEDTEMPVGTYTMINPGDGTGGGMMRQPSRVRHPHGFPTSSLTT